MTCLASVRRTQHVHVNRLEVAQTQGGDPSGVTPDPNVMSVDSHLILEPIFSFAEQSGRRKFTFPDGASINLEVITM
jgi:hypothetical protein